MHHDNIVDDQLTRWISRDDVVEENVELRTWRLADLGGEVHMFADDVQMGILPYSLKDGMRIELVPGDKQAYELVGQALGREHHYGHRYYRFEDSIPAFIRECAQTIMQFGVAQYEIVTERTREGGKPTAFRFQWVTPHTIRKRRGRWVQDIGTKAAEEMGSERFQRVDISRIIDFPVVPPLTERRLLAINRSLAGVGTQLMPTFGLNPADQSMGFDFAAFQHTRTRVSAAATAPVGWNGRGRLGEQITDYYYLHREIRFQRFVVELRSSILARVNRVLQGTLPRFGCQGSIRLAGFPGLPEIENIARNLERGTDLRTAFKEITRI
jgi:hypothetical protein